MPAKKISEPAVADLDDLLDLTNDDIVSVTEDVAGAAAEIDPEDAEIAALRAELERPAPDTSRPIPESQLTPKQREIRELKDKLASRKAHEIETAEPGYENAAGRESILIHFVEDGFSAQGQIWYRGQEVEFAIGGQAYQQTKDRNGNTWLDLDASAQMARYGREYFRRGPWPGKKWDDFSHITDPEERAAAEGAAAAERRRGRAAPVLPTIS